MNLDNTWCVVTACVIWSRHQGNFHTRSHARRVMTPMEFHFQAKISEIISHTNLEWRLRTSRKSSILAEALSFIIEIVEVLLMLTMLKSLILMTLVLTSSLLDLRRSQSTNSSLLHHRKVNPEPISSQIGQTADTIGQSWDTALSTIAPDQDKSNRITVYCANRQSYHPRKNNWPANAMTTITNSAFVFVTPNEKQQNGKLKYSQHKAVRKLCSMWDFHSAWSKSPGGGTITDFSFAMHKNQSWSNVGIAFIDRHNVPQLRLRTMIDDCRWGKRWDT
jgi:hypothetical protein